MNYLVIKRGLDFSLAIIIISILSPLFLVLALIIFLSDFENPIFKQERVGVNGKTFTFYKFRSMPVNNLNVESTEVQQIKITPVGKIIRRTNLDELPQIWNVLLNQMSFIGPRPPITSQKNLISLRKANGSLNLKPGLTGWAQVNAFDNMHESKKAELDGEYARNVSFALDLKIIFKTLVYLTRKPPVY